MRYVEVKDMKLRAKINDLRTNTKRDFSLLIVVTIGEAMINDKSYKSKTNTIDIRFVIAT